MPEEVVCEKCVGGCVCGENCECAPECKCEECHPVADASENDAEPAADSVEEPAA